MAAHAPASHSGSRPTAPASPWLGAPGSALRWLLPIMLCVGLLVVVLSFAVFTPMSQAVDKEPDPAIQAVLADNLFLLHMRVWTAILTAALAGAAFAIAGGQQCAKALVRLELRLRRIADDETELPPTDPAKDFLHFDEVFAYLRSGMERTTRRNRAVMQKVQRPLRQLSQQLTAGEVPKEDVRNSVSAALTEVDAVLDAERRASARMKI